MSESVVQTRILDISTALRLADQLEAVFRAEAARGPLAQVEAEAALVCAYINICYAVQHYPDNETPAPPGARRSLALTRGLAALSAIVVKVGRMSSDEVLAAWHAEQAPVGKPH